MSIEFSINIAFYTILVIGIIYGIELIKQGISTAEIITVLLLVGRLIVPIYAISFMIDEFSAVQIAISELSQFMDYENKIRDGYLEFTGFEDSMELRNASCEYDKSNTVLEKINLKIKKGQRIGICGESGSGKSTLLKLIIRAFDVCAGVVKIDGIDIRKLKIDSYRKEKILLMLYNHVKRPKKK